MLQCAAGGIGPDTGAGEARRCGLSSPLGVGIQQVKGPYGAGKGAEVPPVLTAGAIDFADPAHPHVSLTSSKSLAAASGGRILILWDEGSLTGMWGIITPGQNEITFTTPSLPDEFVAALPDAASPNVRVYGTFVQANDLSYRDIVNSINVFEPSCESSQRCLRTTNDPD